MSDFQRNFLASIPGPQQVLKALTGSLGISSLSGQVAKSTCSRAEISCQTAYSGQDTCCFNYPGGQMLQTQFWDTDPAVGPEDSWTIHGLWPDHCDGGFDQYCDASRKYNNISLILVDAGRRDLLDYMSVYWKDYRGDDNDLYTHEWSKHGTCISTLEPACYTDYVPQQDVVDYFDRTVEVFQKLPSFSILSDAGIVPSYTATYGLAEIKTALEKAHGAEVTVRCRSGALNEIWYHFNVAGNLQTGDFVPSNPDGPKSNCPASGIRYKPKRTHNEPPPSPPPPTTTAAPPAKPTTTDSPFVGKGYLKVSTMGQRRGCLISRGTWFVAGTCATFKAKRISNDRFTMQSSKGPCTFEKSIFGCGPHVSTSEEFTVEDGKLAYQGNTTFFADKAPKGPIQSRIFATQEEHPIELEIYWHEV